MCQTKVALRAMPSFCYVSPRRLLPLMIGTVSCHVLIPFLNVPVTCGPDHFILPTCCARISNMLLSWARTNEGKGIVVFVSGHYNSEHLKQIFFQWLTSDKIGQHLRGGTVSNLDVFCFGAVFYPKNTRC